MTINGLFTEAPLALALPRDLSAYEPVIDLKGHGALAGVHSVSFNHMSAQVMMIVEPGRTGIDIATYGDAKLADDVCVTARDHLALSGGQPYSNAVTDEYKVLIVLRVPPRMSVSTYEFRGLIGIGGSRMDDLGVSLGHIAPRDHTRLHVEHAARLRTHISGNSVLTADVVTDSLKITASGSSMTAISRAYGTVECDAKSSSRVSIHDGTATSGAFIARDTAQVMYLGTVTDEAKVEQHGTGLLTVKDVRTPCEPKIVGTGSVSINYKVYAN